MPLYEVIVVGLGAVGSAATWHLARLGTKVLGIDRYKPPHEFGSSTGETRLTRVAVGEGVEYSPLALRSNEIWREIETMTGQTLFVQCGCLTITGHPNKSMVHGVNTFFDNIVVSAERYNIPHEVFRSADALRSRFPQFAVNGTEVGFLDKGGGYPLRVQQSKLDGWWFIFVDEVPGLGRITKTCSTGSKSWQEMCFARAEKLSRI